MRSDRIDLQRARELLGLPESVVLAYTRGSPPLLNQYSQLDGTALSEREVVLLREALLAEVEAYLHTHPTYLIQMLGSRPFIEAYHEDAGKTRQGPADDA